MSKSNVLQSLTHTDAWKKASESTKLILTEVLEELQDQGLLKKSDLASLVLLVNSMDISLALKTEMSASPFAAKCKNGATIVTPLLSAYGAQTRIAHTILSSFSANPKERRKVVGGINTPQESALDRLMNDAEDIF